MGWKKNKHMTMAKNYNKVRFFLLNIILLIIAQSIT